MILKKIDTFFLEDLDHILKDSYGQTNPLSYFVEIESIKKEKGVFGPIQEFEASFIQAIKSMLIGKNIHLGFHLRHFDSAIGILIMNYIKLAIINAQPSYFNLNNIEAICSKKKLLSFHGSSSKLDLVIRKINKYKNNPSVWGQKWKLSKKHLHNTNYVNIIIDEFKNSHQKLIFDFNQLLNLEDYNYIETLCYNNDFVYIEDPFNLNTNLDLYTKLNVKNLIIGEHIYNIKELKLIAKKINISILSIDFSWFNVSEIKELKKICKKNNLIIIPHSSSNRATLFFQNFFPTSLMPAFEIHMDLLKRREYFFDPKMVRIEDFPLFSNSDLQVPINSIFKKIYGINTNKNTIKNWG